MSLRYAILGVLNALPMTGYDMIVYFERSAGTFWPASHAQIYQELHKMEAEELIAASVEPRGKLAEKRVFRLTERGEEAFRTLTMLPCEDPVERDGVRLQFAYLDLAAPAVTRDHLRAHLARHRERLVQLEERIGQIRARSSPLLQARLAVRPAHEHDTIVAHRVHALRAHVLRAEAEIAWATEGLALIDELCVAQSRVG